MGSVPQFVPKASPTGQRAGLSCVSPGSKETVDSWDQTTVGSISLTSRAILGLSVVLVIPGAGGGLGHTYPTKRLLHSNVGTICRNHSGQKMPR